MDAYGGKLFQAFKYAVYLLLSFNVYVFFKEEHLAAQLQFANGVPLADLIEAYAATIDTFAWVVLLLMFELETYVLDERHFTRAVTLSLHALRALCYCFIAYAFFGYVEQLMFVHGTSAIPEITNLCRSAVGEWSYAIDLDEYVAITGDNCATFSTLAAFERFDTMPALVDVPGLVDIRRLAWVDVINSGVWLLVVLILEIDVRLQERGRFDGLTLKISHAFKFVLYALLFLAAVYWGVKGDFVDFWDAFLWLVAFVFIEMNVFEWRQEIREEQSGMQAA